MPRGPEGLQALLHKRLANQHSRHGEMWMQYTLDKTQSSYMLCLERLLVSSQNLGSENTGSKSKSKYAPIRVIYAWDDIYKWWLETETGNHNAWSTKNTAKEKWKGRETSDCQWCAFICMCMCFVLKDDWNRRGCPALCPEHKAALQKALRLIQGRQASLRLGRSEWTSKIVPPVPSNMLGAAVSSVHKVKCWIIMSQTEVTSRSTLSHNIQSK